MKISPLTAFRAALRAGGAVWFALLLAGWPQALPAQQTKRGLAPVASEILRDPSLPVYRALLIGITDYKHWPRLSTARSECEALGDLLRRDYGFTDIRTLYDSRATRDNIIAQLELLGEKLGPADALLVYFSGHGEYDTNLKKGYWIPTEGMLRANNPAAPAQWVENSTVRDYVAGMKARHVLVINDSCFSGALLLLRNSASLAARENTWYRQAIGQPSRYCISAGGPEETVPSQSVFAEKLQQALQFPLQPVFGARDLALRIRREVAELTSRQPLDGPFVGRGHSENGEFIFIRRSGLDVPQTPVPVVGPRPGDRWVNSLGMKFVPVPGTKVLFSVWETRVQDFDAFVGETGHDATEGMYSLGADEWKQRGDSWKSPGFAQDRTHPVVGVSWEDAQAFCRWLSKKEGRTYRLPSDLEWSAAVGLPAESGATPMDRDGKIEDVFPWGGGFPPPADAGNYAGTEARDANWPTKFGTIDGFRDGYARTSPVGAFKPNRHGIYDLGGNVWEWCEDKYQSDKDWRVLRGGSWLNYYPRNLWSSNRDVNHPGGRDGNGGFGVVVVVESR